MQEEQLSETKKILELIADYINTHSDLSDEKKSERARLCFQQLQRLAPIPRDEAIQLLLQRDANIIGIMLNALEIYAVRRDFGIGFYHCWAKSWFETIGKQQGNQDVEALINLTYDVAQILTDSTAISELKMMNLLEHKDNKSLIQHCPVSMISNPRGNCYKFYLDGLQEYFLREAYYKRIFVKVSEYLKDDGNSYNLSHYSEGKLKGAQHFMACLKWLESEGKLWDANLSNKTLFTLFCIRNCRPDSFFARLPQDPFNIVMSQVTIGRPETRNASTNPLPLGELLLHDDLDIVDVTFECVAKMGALIYSGKQAAVTNSCVIAAWVDGWFEFNEDRLSTRGEHPGYSLKKDMEWFSEELAKKMDETKSDIALFEDQRFDELLKSEDEAIVRASKCCPLVMVESEGRDKIGVRFFTPILRDYFVTSAIKRSQQELIEKMKLLENKKSYRK